VRAWKNLSRPPEPLTDRPRSPAVRRNHGKDAGLSTENRDQQRKPDGGLRARALLRRVVIRLFVVLAAAAGCLDIMAMSRLGGPFASVVTGNVVQLGRSLAVPNRRCIRRAPSWPRGDHRAARRHKMRSYQERPWASP